jgi:DNA polymerase III subunit gamma/tau
VQLLKARLSAGTALDTNYLFAGGHGQGKCVVGDTLVSTDKGVVPIADLMGPNQIDPCGVHVLQERGTALAAYSYRGGLRDTIRVQTHHGFVIEGTPNHRILVMTPSGELDWCRLDELKLSSQACLIPRGLFGEDVDLSSFYYEDPKGSKSISFNAPSKMTPQLGRLLGYMVGDGDGPSRKVSLSCAEPDIIEDQSRLLHQLLGFSSITPDKRRKTLVAVRCCRVQPRAFLAFVGLANVSAGFKEVPWSILRSSKDTIREFLRGYLEADGGVICRSRGIEFTSKSKRLAHQIHLLLLQFGVLSRLYAKRHPKYGLYWRCQIYGTDIENFAKEIGFLSARKSRELAQVVSGVRGLTRAIPHQKERLKQFYAALPRRSRATSDLFRARKKCGPAECNERALRLAVAYDPTNPHVEAFRTILSADLIYDAVTHISTGQAEVYDLNVPDGERFAANGFINHNTTLGRILARALLCENLNKADPEPCNECDNCKAVLDDTSQAYVEQDAASKGTVEHVRGIVDELPFAVFNAPKRIYLFDEAHRMSKDAQDVLLKPLEEKKLVGMFCTTEPEKIRGPIRSRCEEYAIRKVTREELLVRMKYVLEQEGAPYDDDAVLIVIDFSGGHVRDILNRLEMVAQLGKVNLDNVREYLNLGSISIFYEILLALTDPRRAVELVDRACDRSSPDDIATGLAEAAMNSFRMANGMHADFVYVDRALGQQVFDRYGMGSLRLAEHFLSRRNVTRAALFSDILLLAQSSGLPPEGPQPAVVIMAGGVTAPAPQTTPTRPVSVQPAPLPSQPAPAASSSPPSAAATPITSPSSPPAVKRDPRIRPDGIGPPGLDPLALTDDDPHAVPLTPPRNSKARPEVKFTFEGERVDSGLRLLTPEEWRQEFQKMWPGGSA